MSQFSNSPKIEPFSNPFEQPVEGALTRAAPAAPHELREVGIEIARLYREVRPQTGETAPSFSAADEIVARCKLGDKRAGNAPPPNLSDLEVIALAAGQARALLDFRSITKEFEPIRSAESRLSGSLALIATMPPVREALERLAAVGSSVSIVSDPYGITVRPTPSSAAEREKIDQIFDTYETLMRYAPDNARRMIALFGGNLRETSGAIAGIERVLDKHSAAALSPEADEVRRGLTALKETGIEAVVSDMTTRGRPPSGLIALAFTQNAETLRTTFDTLNQRAIPVFLEHLHERLVSPTGERVQREMTRVEELLARAIASRPAAPTLIAAERAPENTARANLAAKLAFLEHRHGERFDAVIDDITRKIGPRAAIDRFNKIERCCRARSGLAHDLVAQEPHLLTLPAGKFDRHIEALRTALNADAEVPNERLTIEALAAGDDRSSAVSRTPPPKRSADEIEREITSRLDSAGFDGAAALALVKHGFFRRGGAFIGHHGLSAERAVDFAAPKLGGDRVRLTDCLKDLIRHDVVVRHGRHAGCLTLSRSNNITQPTLRELVSHVERFWAEQRQA